MGLVVIAIVVIAVALLASSAPTTGFITGKLQAVGGPAPVPPRPLQGTISVRTSDKRTYSTRVSSGGQFLIQVPIGTYSVTGRSPQYEGGHQPCVYLVPIRVNQNAASNVVVSCQEM